MVKSSLGNFEELAKPYQAARRGFDAKVFDLLIQELGDLKGKSVLDVGCGTGIATRQMASYGALVQGCDIAESMIEEARNIDDIEYTVAPTDSLPFDDNTFDMVTAFSAFHWFCDTGSIQEIQRVLKNDAAFAVVNKHDIEGIRRGVVPLFKKYTDLTSGKDDYNPEHILKKSNFERVKSLIIESTEVYSLKEAVLYLQSIALWNAVPVDRRETLIGEIEEFCAKTRAENGELVRRIQTIVVLGRK